MQCLDPNANGRIGFKDFCHAVFTMKGTGGNLTLQTHTRADGRSVIVSGTLLDASFEM